MLSPVLLGFKCIKIKQSWALKSSQTIYGEKENLGSLDNWQSVKTDIRAENGLTIKKSESRHFIKVTRIRSYWEKACCNKLQVLYSLFSQTLWSFSYITLAK